MRGCLRLPAVLGGGKGHLLHRKTRRLVFLPTSGRLVQGFSRRAAAVASSHARDSHLATPTLVTNAVGIGLAHYRQPLKICGRVWSKRLYRKDHHCITACKHVGGVEFRAIRANSYGRGLSQNRYSAQSEDVKRRLCSMEVFNMNVPKNRFRDATKMAWCPVR